MTSVLTRPEAVEIGESYYWFTAEDLERLPEDMRVELIDGELRKMPPPPGEEHGSTTNRFGSFATVYALEHGLGECYAAKTGFKISREPDTVRGPDFAFVARERLPARRQRSNLAMAPDLVLETRSPGQSGGYVEEKIRRWLSSGSRMAIILDPVKVTLTIHRPGAEPRVLGVNDTFDGEDVLPGFKLPVRKLFRDL